MMPLTELTCATTTSAVSQSGWHGKVHQARMDFDQLLQSMQSGDLPNAQQAYSAIQQLLGASALQGAGNTGTGSAGATGLGAVAGDWTALGQALQSGSLSSAESALAQLNQDAQSTAQALGPHRHHHSLEAAQAVYSAMAVGDNGPVSSVTASRQAVGGDLSALGAAMQSGDSSSVQSLLAKLEQDLQASGQTLPRRHHHHGGFGSQDALSAYSAPGVAASAPSVLAGTSATASS